MPKYNICTTRKIVWRHICVIEAPDMRTAKAEALEVPVVFEDMVEDKMAFNWAYEVADDAQEA